MNEQIINKRFKMTFQVELRSPQQILGDLIRDILANTDITDVAPGSDLSTMLEAIAATIYQSSLSSLKILENSDIESLIGNALDKKAESMRLPNNNGGIGRIPASSSSGIITISSSFTKLSTKFYAGKPAPYAGATMLYVENAKGFDTATNKKLYIGRGTADRFEGPISYTSAVNAGNFWAITLSAPLTKNHLYSDLIVLSQGGDRTISAGSIVQTSASNEVPSVGYYVVSAAKIPDGESEVDVQVVCLKAGESGNALAGAIKEFASQPFTGAKAKNGAAYVNGRSTESDEALRKRIKNYPATLSRGTNTAILAAIQGLTDKDTGRSITSAIIVNPSEAGDFSKVYIDDGSGLEPTFNIQPYELLLQAASGQEKTFQVSQFPVTPATAEGSETGPYVLEAGDSLTVVVDDYSESYIITTSNYSNLNAATAYEIVRDLNSQSNIVAFRTTNGGKNIVLTDASGIAEQLQVLSGTLQIKLGLPTAKIRPIFIYVNNILQSFKGTTATLTTNNFSSWNVPTIGYQNNLVVVDGVIQEVTITNADFVQFSSTMATASITEWAALLSQKIAGVKFTVTGQYIVWTTRQTNSSSGTLEILELKADGTPSDWVGDNQMWVPSTSGGILSSVGAEKDYKFNRFTGELTFTNKPAAGSKIEAGSRNTRANIKSVETTNGLYSLAALSGTFGNAKLVVGFDGDFSLRTTSTPSGAVFTPTVQDSVNAPNIIRLFANDASIFQNAVVGDYLYLANDVSANTWNSSIESLYKLKAVGINFTSSPMTYAGIQINVTGGTDVATVTMASHGFTSGARITVTSPIIGGINPSISLANITVTDYNTFTYVMSGPAISGGQTGVASFIYDADTWVEIETSYSQLADWTLLLSVPQNITVGMINLFRCNKSVPQIVDFGSGIGNASVDVVVALINNQISCGKAEKVNGKQLLLRSSDWENGTVGIFATVGSASNVFSKSISESIQSHTAFSQSSYVNGGVPVTSIVNQSSIKPTASYLTIDTDNIDILSTGSEPAIDSPSNITSYPEGFEVEFVTGRQYGLNGRVYNNQTTTPFTGIMRTTKAISPLSTSDTYQTLAGDLNRYSNYALRLRDLPLTNNDKLVVEMDLDSVNKTVSVPAYKKAVIQDIDAITGSGKGQVISLRLQDPEDSNLAFFDNISIYKNFDFRDFKIITKNVGLYRNDISDRALVLRSVGYGSASRIKFALALPTTPNTSTMTVIHFNDFSNSIAQTNLMVNLASSAAVVGSNYTLGNYNVAVTSLGTLYQFVITDVSFVASKYIVGNVLNIGGTGTLPGSYMITGSSAGSITVLSPTNYGLTGPTNTFNAAANPIISFPLAPKTFVDVATSINSYLSANPVVKAEAIGTASPITQPTYISNPNAVSYTGSVFSEALAWHSFSSYASGCAGIWQYDSSNIALNGIKATVQSVDPIFPTTTDALGTTYSPIGEEVYVIPTNSKTLESWLNFNATSSLPIIAETDRISSGDKIQITSKADGSEGAVKITGVTANSVTSFVSGNGTDIDYSTKVKVLSSDAETYTYGQLVNVKNNIASEILRPYRVSPTGTSITQSNTTNINTFFRKTNYIKYLRTGVNAARIVFFRNGMNDEPNNEPLSIGANITLSQPYIGTGIVRVVIDAGVLAARVGDMMYINSTSPFAADVLCQSLGISGTTLSNKPTYLGYPVINVINSTSIEVLAPNITSFGVTTTATKTDIVFLPAIYNEKNIRTNKKEGVLFDQSFNGNEFSYLIKKLGGNLVCMWLQNSASEAADTMKLSELSVNTDDYIQLGTGFDVANQGTFKVIAHNGRNQILFVNSNGGKDELVDSATLSGGGIGQRKWSVGPIKEIDRSVRILDAESVKIGDRLRISTPSTTSQWFPDTMIGSWRVSGIGYVGVSQAVGSLTAVAEGAGITQGSTLVINDGVVSKTFEFTLTSSVSNANYIPIYIGSGMNASLVATAIANAINGLGSNFNISASLSGIVVNLLNRKLSFGPSYNTAISGTASVVLSAVGMSGAAANDSYITPYVDIEFLNAAADIYDKTTGTPIDTFVIGDNDSSIGFIEGTAFSGYRIMSGSSVNPQNTELSDIFLTPRINSSKMSDTFGTQITSLFKLGFEERAFQGIDGYKVFSGLIREAHRVVDGLPTNSILYPGVKAEGSSIEFNVSLIKTIQVSLQVRPKDGVTLNAITEIIKSTVSSYIRGLGVGKPVILSEIIRIVQGLPGVYSVSILDTFPVATDDRIVVQDIENAWVLDASTDISVG